MHRGRGGPRCLETWLTKDVTIPNFAPKYFGYIVGLNYAGTNYFSGLQFTEGANVYTDDLKIIWQGPAVAATPINGVTIKQWVDPGDQLTRLEYFFRDAAGFYLRLTMTFPLNGWAGYTVTPAYFYQEWATEATGPWLWAYALARAVKPYH